MSKTTDLVLNGCDERQKVTLAARKNEKGVGEKRVVLRVRKRVWTV